MRLKRILHQIPSKEIRNILNSGGWHEKCYHEFFLKTSHQLDERGERRVPTCYKNMTCPARLPQSRFGKCLKVAMPRLIEKSSWRAKITVAKGSPALWHLTASGVFAMQRRARLPQGLNTPHLARSISLSISSWCIVIPSQRSIHLGQREVRMFS